MCWLLMTVQWMYLMSRQCNFLELGLIKLYCIVLYCMFVLVFASVCLSVYVFMWVLLFGLHLRNYETDFHETWWYKPQCSCYDTKIKAGLLWNNSLIFYYKLQFQNGKCHLSHYSFTFVNTCLLVCSYDEYYLLSQ